MAVGREREVCVWSGRADKLADVTVDAILWPHTENFAGAVVGLDEAIVRETDQADAVARLFEEGAVTSSLSRS
jgi:hypothetical protein